MIALKELRKELALEKRRLKELEAATDNHEIELLNQEQVVHLLQDLILALEHSHERRTH